VCRLKNFKYQVKQKLQGVKTVKEKMVNFRMTQAEYDQFVKVCNGRVVSHVIRKLVNNYTTMKLTKKA
jgi:hypothetical protein